MNREVRSAIYRFSQYHYVLEKAAPRPLSPAVPNSSFIKHVDTWMGMYLLFRLVKGVRTAAAAATQQKYCD